MVDAPTDRGTWMSWLVFAVWLGTAIPIALFSLLTLELPLWPSFSAESTAEGITIWATFAVWFYITPVVLAVLSRRKCMSASKLDRVKAD